MTATIEVERSRHQQQAEQLRAELVTVKAKADAADQAHQDHRKQAETEAARAADRATKAEADRDAARNEAAGAREEAAKLRGQVEAMQEQQAGLLRALEGRQAGDEGSTPAATTKPAGKSTRKGD